MYVPRVVYHVSLRHALNDTSVMLPQRYFRYPDEDLVESYCRNPDSSERPWCYTSLTAKTFDFCSVGSLFT